MKNIQLIGGKKYTENLPKMKSGFYVQNDMDQKTGVELERQIVYGYFEFTYPGWQIKGRYEWECGEYQGEPVISVSLPDGTYYARRIGRDFLNICRVQDEHENEKRLKKNAEGEFEIVAGKLVNFTPHHSYLELKA